MKIFIISTLLIFNSLSILGADEFVVAKTECRLNKAKTWSTSKNRCLLKQDYKDSLKNYRSCTGKATKELRDECLYNLVSEVTGDQSFDDYNSVTEMLLNSMTLIVSAINWGMLAKGKKFTACTSLKMSTICGGAAVVKDFYINYKGKEATANIRSDFLIKVKEKDEYETQIIAFQAQIDQLKSISDFYKQKATAHMIVGTCYMATVAVAIYEGGQGLQCLEETPEEPTAEETEAATKAKTASGKANTINSVKSPDSGTLFTLFGEGSSGFTKWTGTPWMLAALNTMNFGWQMFLMKSSNEEADKANLLADRLDIAKNQFVDGMTALCPKGHEDKSDLMCYCYEGGKKKSNRTNSQACIALWDARDRQLFVSSKDKVRGALAKERVGCVDLNGKFDPNCKCRKFKDKKGKNACRVSNFSSIKLGGFSNLVNVKALDESLSNISNGSGNPGPFSISEDKLTAIGDALKKQVISKLKSKDKDGNDKPMTGKEFKALEDNLLSKSRAAIAGGASPSPFGKGLKKASSDAMKNIEKHTAAGKRKGLVMEGGKGIGLKKKKKKNTDVSFNMNGGNGSTVQNFSQEYMKKSYNTKDADINSRKDVSIFKILSNRYNKSGYKRLFDD